jgi:hypothetical protein
MIRHSLVYQFLDILDISVHGKKRTFFKLWKITLYQKAKLHTAYRDYQAGHD